MPLKYHNASEFACLPKCKFITKMWNKFTLFTKKRCVRLRHNDQWVKKANAGEEELDDQRDRERSCRMLKIKMTDQSLKKWNLVKVQHSEVQSEKQIEKSLWGVLHFRTALELLGRWEILEQAVQSSFPHLYHCWRKVRVRIVSG